jgi:hypothetical protein
VTSTPDDTVPPARPPAPLNVAASLVAVEAVIFVILGVAELAAFESAKAVMGATTALFFLAYGAGLGFCAWGISRLRSWARAPIVVAQLIQLFVAWSFYGGETTLVAIGLAVVAGIVLAGIFHPASLDALAERD